MTHDLIVVGGGPAGSACARRAAQLELDVLVLEKAHHPRKKVCGGGITPRVKDALDFDFSPVIEREQCGQNFRSPKEVLFTFSRPVVTGYTVKREDFDHFLLRKAEETGAEVLQGIKVTDVVEESESVRVIAGNETYSARLVVGADGPNSTVARKTGLKPRWENDEIALCIECAIPIDPSDIMRISGDPEGSDRVLLDFYFGFLPNGYGWAFPKKNEVSLGLGSYVSKLVDLPGHWKKFIKYYEETNGVKCDLSEQTAGRVPLSGIIENTCSKNIMLVGDAAGFVNITTGEGISFGIKSAMIAADVAKEIITGVPDIDTMTYHRRSIDAMGEELLASPHPIFSEFSKKKKE